MSRQRKNRPVVIPPVPVDEMVELHIAVKIDASEMRDWTPSRITRFFGGMASVVHAKHRKPEE